ncbi:uncharacterized protein LOC103315804 [Nasonia vitripennis]|uniref:Uncharacterized protein n=1 Tax=Nasonia vitripennis TaxID=7425 RepID=A0A7M7QAW1_NASVI|nr:uncharacterized protein LOC103315804 [Nasonia vitripennis]
MSVFGSAKTNFSNSEMSLGSSALMTAASTYTLSDCDYETSSELLSPREAVANDDDDDSQISPTSSRSSDIPDYDDLAIRTSSVLLDKAARESSVSIGADGYVLSAKSDTCLSQQSRAISDFVNEVLIDAQQQSNTASPIQNECHSTPRAENSSLIAAIEIEPDLQQRHSSSNSACYCSRETLTRQESSAPDDDKIKATEVATSLSEAKNKIIENLAQVTYDKLFSRPGWRRSGDTDRSSQGEPVSKASSQKSRLSRRSSRCSGVESILRIDYELQPLNLRLSRLLAEFRAMDLRGKIGFVDPSFYEFSLPRDGSFASTAGDNETRKTVETCEQFLRPEERVVVASRSEKSCARSSRQGDGREPYSVEGCQLRLQSSEESSLHCVHQQQRPKRNAECRKQSRHHRHHHEKSDECPSSAQKARTCCCCCSDEDTDFGCCCCCCRPPGKKDEIESSMSRRQLISPAFLTRPMEAGDSLSNGSDAGVTCGRSIMMIEMCDLREARCAERRGRGDR